MSFIDMVSILGLIISVVSTIVAIVQTKQKRDLEKALNEMRRVRRANTWTTIAIVLRTYDSLTEARDCLMKKGVDKQTLISKISSARRGTVDQWRDLIKQAVIDEPNFSEETIERWAQEGKLENEWRIAQVRRLLDGSELKRNA